MTVAERPAAPPVRAIRLRPRGRRHQAAWMAGDRFAEHHPRSTRRARSSSSAARSPPTTPVARDAADGVLRAAARALRRGQAHHHLRAVLARAGGGDEAGRASRAIYLGGWATSAKGSATEDPGPDLASYPLSQVPDEAAALVRALLTADRNQRFARVADDRGAARGHARRSTSGPFIIADADTGHGGDAHVRNLIRRFVEVGVPGYHIEDQKPGAKKCGHQGGKVLVAEDEQIKRLNAARFQLDIMQVAGIIVARTDAESATLLDGRERRARPAVHPRRDQPRRCRRYKSALPRHPAARSTTPGVDGHQRPPAVRDLARPSTRPPTPGSSRVGLAARHRRGGAARMPPARARSARGRARHGRRPLPRRLAGRGRPEDLRRGGRRRDARSAPTRGSTLEMTADEWLAFAAGASFVRMPDARRRRWASTSTWDPELAEDAGGLLPGRRAASTTRSPSRSPPRRSPTCCGWRPRRPTWTTRRRFADAIHAVYPGQDARLQPVAVVQLGHDRHERRRDAARSPRSSGSWASSSTSSPTAATRSTASPPRSSRPRCARTACSRWRGCSGSSACSSRRTGRRRRSSAGRAPTPR